MTPHLLDMYTQSDCRVRIKEETATERQRLRGCHRQWCSHMQHEAGSAAGQAQGGGRQGVRDNMADQLTRVELSLGTSAHQHALQLMREGGTHVMSVFS